MKRIYLLKTVQHNIVSYTGSIRAKDLVRLARNIEVSTVQEAQRPLSGTKVNSVAKHVNSGDDGMLPGAIIIASIKPVISVHPEESLGNSDLYYMDFPETDLEFEEYRDSIEVMDGQHRLFSFREGFVLLDSDIRYDFPFELYLQPTLRQRRVIFKVANENQDKVNANLLMWFREKLGLFSQKERTYHPLVRLLNEENASPLRGRIIMGAEHVKYGLKCNQLIKILDKAKLNTLSFRGEALSEERRLGLIAEYLRGWQLATGCDFSTQDASFGPLTKISGIRYILLLLPAMYEKIIAEHSPLNAATFAALINRMFAMLGTTSRDFFDENSQYNMESQAVYVFRGEGSTVAAAELHANLIKNMDAEISDDYNPFQ